MVVSNVKVNDMHSLGVIAFSIMKVYATEEQIKINNNKKQLTVKLGCMVTKPYIELYGNKAEH